MSIRSQDTKVAIVICAVVALWFGSSKGFLNMSVSEAATGSVGLAIFIPLIYLMKRKSSYLTDLIKQ